MTIQPFTIQAVSDAAAIQLLVDNRLWLLGEGAPQRAPGVTTSQIGDAVLESTGVKLAGRFVFLAIDDEKFGIANTQALRTALADAEYKGPTLRAMLGVGPFDPRPDRPTDPLGALKYDAIWTINQECQRRIKAVWPVEKQITNVLGVSYPAEDLAAMASFIDAHVAASNAAQDAILAVQPGPNAFTQVRAVTATWPAN